MNTQTICKALGSTGCYFLSLLHLAGRDAEAVGLYRSALRAGEIDEDCFVKNPSAVMSLAAGGAWSVRHEGPTYIPKSDEYEILRFEQKAAMKTFAHFVVGDGRGQVAYDPLDRSQTVLEGQLVSKRIIKRGA